MSALPRGWESLALREIAKEGGETIDPRKFPAEEFELFSIPSFSDGAPENVVGADIGSTKQFVQQGDVLLSKIVPHIRRVWVVPKAGGRRQIASGEWIVYRTSQAEPEFIKAALSESGFRTKFLGTVSGVGGSLMRASPSRVAEFHIPLPPLAEQKRIVAKLDALNAKSARARTEIARIESLVTRYKQAVLSRAFSAVDTERISLLNLTEFVTSGSRGWAKFYSDEGPLFIRIGNTVRGTIVPDLDDIQRVSPPEGAEGVRTRVQPNDILVTITADLGRVALIDDQMGEAYVNQHLALVRLLNPDSAAFFAWYLVSDEGQAQLHRNNRGATRSGLGLDDIRQVQMPTPPLEEQHEIVRGIESAFAKIDRLAKEAKRALGLVGKLDEAILAKAVRGELAAQLKDEEPASLLLERIMQARQSQPAKAKKTRSTTQGKLPDMALTIVEALTEAKDWLSAQALFERCGVQDGSSTEEVEMLYRQLLSLEREAKIQIEEVADPVSGAKLGNRVRLRK